MAAAPNKKSVKCPACGAVNAPPPSNGRCASCGAAMEVLKPARSAELERQRRYQQEGFSIVWCCIALVVQSVLTAALVVGLPMVVPTLDFEGSNGMVVAIPVWFIGGMLLGMISPGKTFIEPVVASFLVAIPTVFYLARGEPVPCMDPASFFSAMLPRCSVRSMPLFMYLIMGMIGVLFTLIGSYIGERIQMGPPPKPVD
jgi:hypothetical protein